MSRWMGGWVGESPSSSIYSMPTHPPTPCSCYPVSWYLGVDFQLFLLTPLVALLAASYHQLTLVLLALGT